MSRPAVSGGLSPEAPTFAGPGAAATQAAWASSSRSGACSGRKRRPEQPAYLVSLAHERFQPDDLLRQAVEAEQAGFDGVCCSDHLEPWWAPGAPTPTACGNAWVWLGAAGQATSHVSLGTAVTGL